MSQFREPAPNQALHGTTSPPLRGYKLARELGR